LQHSILSRCSEQHTIAVDGVNRIVSELSLAKIRPIVSSYIPRSRAGPNFMLEMCKALKLSSVVRVMLSELLIDSQDGKIDVREGGVICAMLCGADDAQATFAYAAELYSLGPLQETDDVSRMSFVMQSYSMFRAFWKVSVHIASSFITSFRTIDSSEILQREMLQSTTMRLGLYLDIIIRTFQQTNLRETNWQEQMDAKVGHVQWLAALCAAFASSMAGILVAADPLEKEAFALPSSNQLKEYGKAFAYTPPSSPTATSKSMEPEPESEGEDGVNKSDTAWAIRAPSFEGELQHGKSMATAYFKLQIVRGQGVCLCKYKNQKEAMAEVAKAGGAKGVTKTRLPLNCSPMRLSVSK
jgi:hypothetical protein